VLHGGGIAALGAPPTVLSPQLLSCALGVEVRRLDDPDGGPPMFRVVAPRRSGNSIAIDRHARAIPIDTAPCGDAREVQT